jgi:hypothetical protein
VLAHARDQPDHHVRGARRDCLRHTTHSAYHAALSRAVDNLYERCKASRTGINHWKVVDQLLSSAGASAATGGTAGQAQPKVPRATAGGAKPIEEWTREGADQLRVVTELKLDVIGHYIVDFTSILNESGLEAPQRAALSPSSQHGSQAAPAGPTPAPQGDARKAGSPTAAGDAASSVAPSSAAAGRRGADARRPDA